RLVRNAIEALRVRLPLLLTRSYELDALPAQGRVRVRGTLAAGQLRGRGVSVAIDLDPERTLSEGDGEVEIIGEVTSAPSARGYPAAPAPSGPGRGMLYIFRGRDRITRRLLVAASVELVAAAGMAFALVGLAVFAGWLYRLVR